MLYQNKENKIRQYTEIDKINGFIPKAFKPSTEIQLNIFAPDFDAWYMSELVAWTESQVAISSSTFSIWIS